MGSEKFLPEFLDHLLQEHDIAGNRFTLFGASNGGISAFRIACMAPEYFQRIVAIPGCPLTKDYESLTRIAHLPVRLMVGEHDDDWVTCGRRVLSELERLGCDVQLEIVLGEQHDLFRRLDAGRLQAVLEEERPHL